MYVISNYQSYMTMQYDLLFIIYTITSNFVKNFEFVTAWRHFIQIMSIVTDNCYFKDHLTSIYRKEESSFWNCWVKPWMTIRKLCPYLLPFVRFDLTNFDENAKTKDLEYCTVSIFFLLGLHTLYLNYLITWLYLKLLNPLFSHW